jgi:hypothetical protein
MPLGGLASDVQYIFNRNAGVSYNPQLASAADRVWRQMLLFYDFKRLNKHRDL